MLTVNPKSLVDALSEGYRRENYTHTLTGDDAFISHPEFNFSAGSTITLLPSHAIAYDPPEGVKATIMITPLYFPPITGQTDGHCNTDDPHLMVRGREENFLSLCAVGQSGILSDSSGFSVLQKMKLVNTTGLLIRVTG